MKPARTLPLRCAPLPGEALDAWIEAAAAQLRMPTGELLVALGLHGEGEQAKNGTPWMTLLLPQEADHMAAATGIPPERLRAMTLEHFDQRALVVDRDRRRVDGSLVWGRGTAAGSRFCPDCLRENEGRWPLVWRLGWSFACLAHRRLLADFCPRCGSRQRKRPHRSHIIPRPGRCDYLGPPPTDGAPRFRCLHRLSETETMVFDAGHPALRAQQDLLEVIEEGVGAFGVYVHDRQPALAVLADMKGIARRVLFHMSADHMTCLVPAELVQAHLHARRHNSGLSSRLRRAPVDPARVAPAYAATAAVGATAAWSILGQADCRQAAPRMRELLDAIVDRGYWTSPTATRTWGSYTSPLLESVHLMTVAPTMRPSATLRYRTALSVPSSPTTTASQLTVRARKIPGLIWPLWSVRLNPVPQVREHLGAALAAGLLLVDSKIELPAAVKKLGDLIDQPILTNVLQALRDDAHYEGIQLALIHLAAYLDSQDVPIDYARRRRLNYTDLLPENEWIDLCHRTLMDPGTGTRHKVARCYLFEKISGLPHTRIPNPPRDGHFFRSSMVHFPHVLIQATATELDRVGREFLDRNHLAHEPLTWQPPSELLRGLDLPRADPAGIDIDALHRRVLAGQTSPRIADELGTDVPTLRYVLGEHPPALPEPTPHEPRTGGRGRTRLHVARRTVSKGQLEHLYVQQEKTFLAIARETGVDRKILAALADEYGIARSARRPGGSLDRGWLHEQYVVRGRTFADIGREVGMSGPSVRARAREYRIQPQNNRQPRCPQHEYTTAPTVIQSTLGNSFAIRRLRVFIQVVRYRTLTEACQTLGIHPATLTLQLKRLETDLGGPLLIRPSRGQHLKLTDLGRSVVDAVGVWAHSLVGQPRETWDRAERHSSPSSKTKRKSRFVADAPGVDRFPAFLQPAVRTVAGRRRLYRFLQAAGYSSLAAYCHDVGISPSSLTPKIQQLERDLRGQLLLRSRRGRHMSLTDFGKVVLAAAQPYADQLIALQGDSV